MKSKRQEKILELIAQYAIETQEELLERLSECGIPSTQAMFFAIAVPLSAIGSFLAMTLLR